MTDTTPSFMRSLCMGRIEEDIVFPFPQLEEHEQEMLRTVVDSVDDLLTPLHEEFRTWDAKGEMPKEFLERLEEFGLFGLVIPEEYGGMGLSATAYSRTLQQIARHDASVGVTVGAHSSIGIKGLLLHGTDEQRQRFLPRLATGEMIGAFCLTEPGAGSDAASIKTTATRDGDDWILSGSKVWITNGGIADFFTVFAKTGDAEQRANLGCFVVTRDMEGVSTGPHEDKMGIRASSTTTVYFDNVRVPDSNRIGEPNGGFKVAMSILNNGRTGLGGGTVGGMKRLIELSSKYASERKQFGEPIASYGLIKQKLGQMMIDCYATESMVTMVGGLIDRGHQDYAIEAAISKVFGTEALWRTADEALQVAGGNGFMREYPYERFVRDARINRIYEGTNEILRLFIALSAMKDVGTELRELGSSLEGVFDDPIKGFGLLRDYAIRRAGIVTGFGHRTALQGLHDALQEPAVLVVRSTRQLAQAADRILRKHGRKIIGKQFASRRLADIMIDLFALVCVLSRVDTAVKSKGSDTCKHEIEILEAFSRQVERRVQDNFARIDDNEDEQIKSLAEHAVDLGKYPWDVL